MKRQHLVFLVWVGLLGNSGFASTLGPDSRLESLAASRMWQLLLHYKTSLWSGQESEADGDGFFLAKTGKWQPVAELKANLAAFMAQKLVQGEPYECRFPARAAFLRRALQLQVRHAHCPDYAEWLTSIAGVGVAVVFASDYPYNPSSVFGHTFLKITSAAKSRLQGGQILNSHAPILDYLIAYEAVTDGKMNLEFALRGLMGGYAGRHSMAPYYMKVTEYNERESRDLWEYQLAIDVAQTQRLLAHFWELYKNTYFEYFFLDENCSYHILGLLEVARPDWHLSDNFYLYVAPTDALKRVTSIPGAVRAISYRPSLYKRMLAAVRELNPQQKAQLTQVLAGEVAAASVSDSAVLKAAITSLFYQKQKAMNHHTPLQSTVFLAALGQTAQLGMAVPSMSSAVTKSWPAHVSRPDQSHDIYRIGVGYGHDSQEPYGLFSFRLGLHDQLGLATGYPAYSQVDAFRIDLQLKQGAGPQLKEFVAMDAISLSPVSTADWETSWQLRLAMTEPQELACSGCQLTEFSASAGLSHEVFSRDLVFFYLGGARLDYGSVVADYYRLGPMMAIGALASLDQATKVRLRYRRSYDLTADAAAYVVAETSLEVARSWHRNWSLRIGLNTVQGAESATNGHMAVYRYF